MKTARVFKVDNRLQKAVGRPGGKTVADAIRAAEARIEAIRGSCVASLDDQAARLAAIAADARGEPPTGDIARLYAVADEIFAVAGAFRLEALAEAAYGLCDLIECFRGSGEVNWPAIDVHVAGIRLLCAGRGEAEPSVMEGLRQVRSRFIDVV